VAKKTLLIVDSDLKTLRMLEISLRKAGFSVTTSQEPDDAWNLVKLAPPNLILTDTRFGGDETGFDFVKRLKGQPEMNDIPVMFLSSDKSLEKKVKGLELGVEDYLTKPIYLKEVITRVRVLLDKREKEGLEQKGRSATFSGVLGEMGLVDIIQTVEIGRKSGTLHIKTKRKDGRIFFTEGRVVNATTSVLTGERAFYRMLVWNEGTFSMDFGSHDQQSEIMDSTQGLLMEGMRRVDEWGRLLEQLPPLEAVFEINYDELSDRLAEIPDDVNSLLRLFDGVRSLIDVVDQSGFGDLEALEVASKLFFEGLIFEVSTRPSLTESERAAQSAPIEAWLDDGDDDFDLGPASSAKLPSSGHPAFDMGKAPESLSRAVGLQDEPDAAIRERNLSAHMPRRNSAASALDLDDGMPDELGGELDDELGRELEESVQVDEDVMGAMHSDFDAHSPSLDSGESDEPDELLTQTAQPLEDPSAELAHLVSDSDADRFFDGAPMKPAEERIQGGGGAPQNDSAAHCHPFDPQKVAG
jgi:DNA-binding response OmpR family regulator